MPLASYFLFGIGCVGLFIMWLNAAFMADCRHTKNRKGLAYARYIAYELKPITWAAFALGCLAIRFFPPA